MLRKLLTCAVSLVADAVYVDAVCVLCNASSIAVASAFNAFNAKILNVKLKR